MIDRILNNRWSLRIIALLLAAVLFISVSTGDNVRDKRIFQTRAAKDSEVVTNVPVQVYYDKTNLSVSGIPETVKVTISGPRSIVKSAKAQQEFTVYADLRNAHVGSNTVTLHTRNLSSRLKATIHPKQVKVNVQERVTKKFSVGTEIGKVNLADGYSASEITTDPKQVTISGAKETIDKIAYVKATLNNKKKYKSNFKEEATVTAFDSKLNKLDVSISPQKVTISGKVKKVGKTVPIELKQTGTVTSGLSITDLTTDTLEVVVLGSDKVLSKISKIEVPVSVSNITADTVKEVDVPVPKKATGVETKTIEVRIKTASTDSSKKKSSSDKNSSNDSSDKSKDENKTDSSDDSSDSNKDKTNSDENDNNQSEDSDQDTSATKTINNLTIRPINLESDLKATMRSPKNGKISVMLKGSKKAVNKISASSLQVSADLGSAKADSIFSTSLTVKGIPSNISYTTSPEKSQFVISDKKQKANKAEESKNSDSADE